MEEEEYYEEESRWTNYIKWAAGTVGFLAVMGLFIWVTVPPPPPELAPMVRVSSLPHSAQLSPGSDKRLILVGDIHGMHKEFRKLLKKADFNPKTDQLVLLGDFITKGPDSIKVVDDAIKYNAACVRGNHEDDILAYYAKLRGINAPVTYPPDALEAPATFGIEPHATMDPTTGTDWERSAPTDGDDAMALDIEQDLLTANGARSIDEGRDKPLTLHLEPRHIRYIESCPGILKLGKVKSNGGKGVAVHGGLMWDEPDLEKQRPEIIFRLRSLLPPKFTTPSDDEGKPWAAEWNHRQKSIDNPLNRLTVFYGHDAGRGLKLRKYTKGLDSRCVRGGDLSAMVLSMNKRGKVKSEVVTIDCPEYKDLYTMSQEGGDTAANDADQLPSENMDFELDDKALQFDQFLGV